MHYGAGNYEGKRWTYAGTVEGKTPSEKLKNFVFKFDESIEEREENNLYIYDKLKTLVFNDDQKSTLETHYKRTGNPDFADQGKHDSTFHGTFKWTDKPLFTYIEEYHHDLTGDVKTVSQKNVGKYGDKEASSDINLKYKSDLSDISADGKFALPLEKIKKVEAQFNHKVNFFKQK